MKSHTGEEMTNQVLQYLREVCKMNFSKCRVSLVTTLRTCLGIIRGCSKKFFRNKLVCYNVSCAAHSLNLVGGSTVDCCQEAVNFLSTGQLLFFQPQPAGGKFLKVVLEMKLS